MSFDRDTYIKQSLPIEFELSKLYSLEEKIIIFEIGACEGEDSIRYSKLFPNSTIYTFEPLPENKKLILENFKKYNVDNAHLYEIALSNFDGETDFHVSSANQDLLSEYQNVNWNFGNKSSSLLMPEKHNEEINFIKFENLIKVKTTTLQIFCNNLNINIIDIIHMDVQGAELMVLKGANEYIDKIKVIWMEVSDLEYYKGQPLAKEVESFMKKNNFFLVKNTLVKNQGDHLYVSKKYFNKWYLILLRYYSNVNSIILRVKNRIKSLF